MKSVKKYLKQLWDYIWKSDSLGSYVLNFILAFVIIKYIFFPVTGFVLNNDYPIVAIVSGSMEHKITNGAICDKQILNIDTQSVSHDEWWTYCGDYYEDNYAVSQDIFKTFPHSNGLNIGDIIILYGKDPDDIKIGEILIFIPEDRDFYEQKGPVIHRVMHKWEEDGTMYFQTKGDHNPQSFENFERMIPEEDVIGVGVVRIPLLGYGRIIINDIMLFIMGAT